MITETKLWLTLPLVKRAGANGCTHVMPRSPRSRIRHCRMIVVLTALLGAVFLACGAAVAAQMPGLVSEWQGNGNANDSVGTNNGTLVGAGYTTGHNGQQAFSFDGQDDYVSVPDSPSLEPSSAVSVSAWVKSTGPGGARYVVSKGASACSNASYALYSSGSGGLEFYVDTPSGYRLSPDAGTGIWDGTWHYVVGAYSGTAVTLSVDGTEVGPPTPASGAIVYNLPTHNNLFIGAYDPTGCGRFFNGEIQDVRLYNQGISGAPVKGIAHQIELYAPAQQSARVCGTNQHNRHVCHTFNTVGPASDYRLAGWWWKATVSISNFEGLDGRGHLLDTTSCNAAVTRRASGFAHCDGFDYTWLYGDLVNHPRLFRFSVPHLGDRWGIVTIADFISSAHIGPGGVGYGDDRGFAANGVPAAAGSRVALALDFTDGIGVLRIDASCGVGPFGCGGPLPITGGVYGVEPPGYGNGSHDPLTARNIFTFLSRRPAFLFTLAAGNGAFAGVGAWMLGEIDLGAAIKAEAGGNLKATLSLKNFPSTEAYQIVKGHVRTLIRKREAGWKASQRIDMAPDDSSLKTLNFHHYTICTSSVACA